MTLEELLDQYGIDYITTGKNSSKHFVNINCTHCPADEKHKLGIHRSMTRASCWACGPKKIYEVVTALNIPWDVWKTVAEEQDYEGNTSEKIKELTYDSVPIPGESLLPVHKRYLKERGLDPEWLEREYKVKGTLKEKDFKLDYKIIFPLTFNDVTISYLGRSYLPDVKMRYCCADPDKESYHHKYSLFNIDKATGDSVILVEGVFDALKLIYASGNYNIVASYGINVKPEQVQLLRKRFKRVFIMFDAEDNAQRRAKDIFTVLTSFGIYCKMYSLKGFNDAGELDIPTAKLIVNGLLGGE